MASRESRSRLRAAVGGMCAVLLAGAAMAAPEAKPARDPQAMAVFDRMAKTLADASSIRVSGEIAWDVVQADGQTLEFGATRELVMKRPDQLRVNLVRREGGERQLYYDGKQVVLFDVEQDVYASVPRTGPVSDVAEFVGAQLGIPVALAELLDANLAASLDGKIASASLVGKEQVDGVECDHLALRNEVGGIQMWIDIEHSLPRRITITYEHEEGRPQFRARFADWDLSPRISDSMFTFEPPKGAEKIAFAVRKSAPPKEGSR